jgi:hypothetical protein
MVGKQKVCFMTLFSTTGTLTYVGLGLHLQSISQQFPDKYDLHETRRLLVSLTPYDHLHRIFRLCTIHVKRNIRKLSVSDSVKKLMCSLVCVSHENWDGAIATIIAQGGKQAIGKYIVSHCVRLIYLLALQIGYKIRFAVTSLLRHCAGKEAISQFTFGKPVNRTVILSKVFTQT